MRQTLGLEKISGEVVAPGVAEPLMLGINAVEARLALVPADLVGGQPAAVLADCGGGGGGGAVVAVAEVERLAAADADAVAISAAGGTGGARPGASRPVDSSMISTRPPCTR